MKLEDIKTIVEAYAKTGDINTPSRKDEYVEARYIYYELAKTHTKRSLSSIAVLVRRDHTSVIHGLKKFIEFEGNWKFMNGVHQLCELEIARLTNEVAPEVPELLSFTEKIKRLEFTTSELIKTVNALINGLPVEYQRIEA